MNAAHIAVFFAALVLCCAVIGRIAYLAGRMAEIDDLIRDAVDSNSGRRTSSHEEVTTPNPSRGASQIGARGHTAAGMDGLASMSESFPPHLPQPAAESIQEPAGTSSEKAASLLTR